MALRRKTAYEEWAARYRSGKLASKENATTMSGVPLQPLYTPEDLEGWNYEQKLGYPGEFPYTRGVYPSMHRGQPWTIRQLPATVPRRRRTAATSSSSLRARQASR